jgi:hypothetical protein
LFSVTDSAPQIVSIIMPVMDAIMLEQPQAADALPEADARMHALFKQVQQ